MELKLKLVKKIYETADAVTLYFRQPFFSKIKYESGQFLTLIFTIDGEDYYRAYSLSSAYKVDSYITVTVKKVPDGIVSNYIVDKLEKGTKVRMLPPRGNFQCVPDPQRARNIVLIGGGSGITPLFSIAKKILKYEPKSHVSLIFSNVREISIIFKRDLIALETKYPTRFKMALFLDNPPKDWIGEVGRFTQERLKETLFDLDVLFPEKSEYYMCGPGGMIDEAKLGLVKLGIPEAQVFHENFKANPELKPKPTESFPARTIKLIINKIESTFTVPSNESVLDAALHNKVKIPYSCGSGSCATCMCQVKQGEVKMLSNGILTEAEIKKGYVLSCLSYPVTDDVVLEVV